VQVIVLAPSDGDENCDAAFLPWQQERFAAFLARQQGQSDEVQQHPFDAAAEEVSPQGQPNANDISQGMSAAASQTNTFGMNRFAIRIGIP
jgi:hypothetical protein